MQACHNCPDSQDGKWETGGWGARVPEGQGRSNFQEWTARGLLA